MASLNRIRYCLGVTIVGSLPPPRMPDSLTQLSSFLSHVNVRMKSNAMHRSKKRKIEFSSDPIYGQSWWSRDHMGVHYLRCRQPVPGSPHQYRLVKSSP
jgi:hypothetical protein